MKIRTFLIQQYSSRYIVITTTLSKLQPTNQPTFLPTSQPTIDTSFKKRSKDMVVDVSDGTKETIQEVRSGMKSMIRGLRRAIQPRGYNNDL